VPVLPPPGVMLRCPRAVKHCADQTCADRARCRSSTGFAGTFPAYFSRAAGPQALDRSTP